MNIRNNLKNSTIINNKIKRNNNNMITDLMVNH